MPTFQRFVRLFLLLIVILELLFVLVASSAKQGSTPDPFLPENGFRYPQALAGMDATGCSWATTILATNLSNNTFDCVARIEVQGVEEGELQINGATNGTFEVALAANHSTRFLIDSEGALTDFGVIVSSNQDNLSCADNLATSLAYSQTCSGGVTEIISVDRPFEIREGSGLDCFSFAYDSRSEYGVAFASRNVELAHLSARLFSADSTTMGFGSFELGELPQAILLRDILGSEPPEGPGFVRVCPDVIDNVNFADPTIYATALSYTFSEGTLQFGTLPLQEDSRSCAEERDEACIKLADIGWIAVQVTVNGQLADLLSVGSDAYVVQLQGQDPLGEIVITGFEGDPNPRNAVGVVSSFRLFGNGAPAGIDIVVTDRGDRRVTLSAADFTMLDESTGFAEFSFR